MKTGQIGDGRKLLVRFGVPRRRAECGSLALSGTEAWSATTEPVPQPVDDS